MDVRWEMWRCGDVERGGIKIREVYAKVRFKLTIWATTLECLHTLHFHPSSWTFLNCALEGPGLPPMN